jgi:hypothetical protein
MNSLRRHMTFANVASLMALIFSMSGGALAARHYLIHSTNQISPKVLRKLKGAPGEIGPIGPQGPIGLVGPKGSNGARGEPAPSVLGSGVSESGDFGVRGKEESGSLAQTVTFRMPLPTRIYPTQVIFLKSDAPPTTECPGPGFAAKSYLCVYLTRISGVGEPVLRDGESNEGLPGAGRFGFTIEDEVTGEPAILEGTYTVTGT